MNKYGKTVCAFQRKAFTTTEWNIQPNRGMLFVETVIASGKSKSKWLKFKQ